MFDTTLVRHAGPSQVASQSRTIAEAVDRASPPLELLEATTVQVGTHSAELPIKSSVPILVGSGRNLHGIITAFDLL